MSTIQTYGKEILALLVPLIGWVLSYFFQAKARLLLATPHSFSFLVQEPLHDADGTVLSSTQTANTRSLVVTNSGRLTATKVELVFNWKPPCINIWPPRSYNETEAQDGRYAFVFDSLAPNEQIGCYLLSVNAQVPELVTARSDQCAAIHIEMYPQPHVAMWKRRLAAFLLFGGIAATVYALIVLLQIIILNTPIGYAASTS